MSDEEIMADVLSAWLQVEPFFIVDKEWLIHWFSDSRSGVEESAFFIRAFARLEEPLRRIFVLRLAASLVAVAKRATVSTQLLFHFLTLAKGVGSQELLPALGELNQSGCVQGEWEGYNLPQLLKDTLLVCGLLLAVDPAD